MKKKRVLFVNDTLGLGGIERSLCDVLRHIDFERFEVDLYLNSTKGELIDQLPNQVRIVEPNMDECYGSYFSVIRRLVKNKAYREIWLRTICLLASRIGYTCYYLLRPLFWEYGKYDYVVAYKEGAIAQFARRAFRHSKIISWWHCGSEQSITRDYENYDCFDDVIAVSNVADDVLRKMLPHSIKNSYVISNMIDMESICKRAQEYKPNYKVGIKHIVTVARLSPEKHLIDIIPCVKSMIAVLESGGGATLSMAYCR